MDPVSHFFVALVPLTAYTLLRHRRVPSGETILVLLFATQLPDLIDKPLAWTFGVLPSGRMLAHSLVIALPVVAVVLVLTHRHGYGKYGAVFGFGYLSHIAADFYHVLYLGTDYYFFPNLFWPLLEANPDHDTSFAAHVPELSAVVIVPIAVVGLVCAYAVLDATRA